MSYMLHVGSFCTGAISAQKSKQKSRYLDITVFVNKFVYFLDPQLHLYKFGLHVERVCECIRRVGGGRVLNVGVESGCVGRV